MFIVYALMYSLPTSYVQRMALQLSQRPGSTKSAAEWLADLNAKYGMDKGPIMGYFVWLKSAVKGDFGDSWFWTVSCTQKFQDVIWYSFVLSLISFIFISIIFFIFLNGFSFCLFLFIRN